MHMLTMDNIQIFAEPPTETRSWFAKIKHFCKEVAVAAKNKVVSWVRGFYRHAESVGVLTLASFGLSALIGELPFLLTLPWWIEATMVIPVFSVLIIFALVSLNEYRTKRRLAHA